MSELRAQSHLPVPELDRRIRLALLAAAKEGGYKAYSLMHTALTNGPSPGGTAEAIRYFGGEANLQIVLTQMNPMIWALESGIPGFCWWLDHTGYGNDCMMIRALHAWLEKKYSSGDTTKELAYSSEAQLNKLN